MLHVTAIDSNAFVSFVKWVAWSSNMLKKELLKKFSNMAVWDLKNNYISIWISFNL